MKIAIEYLVFFVAIQLIVTYCVMGVWYLVAGGVPKDNGALLVTTTILFGVITVALFLWRRWMPVNGDFLKSRPLAVLFWTFLAAMGVIVPSLWLQEKMPELPNFLNDSFEGLVNTLEDIWHWALLHHWRRKWCFAGLFCGHCLRNTPSHGRQLLFLPCCLR